MASTFSCPVLSHLFNTIFSKLPILEQNTILKAMSRFTARLLGTREFDSFVKYRVSDEAYHLAKRWRRWALGSYYWGNLWRAVVSAKPPEQWGVWSDDVDLVLTELTQTDHRKLQSLRRRMTYHRFSAAVFDSMRRNLLKISNKLYRVKLRFLTRYDPTLSREDMVGDLMAVGIRVIRRYEHEGNAELAFNYAYRSMINYAGDLIDRHTSSRRCRILRSPKENTPKVVSFEEFQMGPQTDQPEVLFLALNMHLGSKYEAYARAVLDFHPEFERWVMAKGNRYPSTLRTRSTLARQWTGISSTELEVNLVPVLQERVERHYLACS
jgi:hypothetical protein